MAARNPTDWTRWIDLDDIRPGDIIKEEEYDDVFNDLEYCLDAESLSISENFAGATVTYSGSAHNWVLIKTWKLYQQDRCDVDAVEPTAKFTCYVHSDGTAVPGVRVVTTAASNNDVSHVGSASATTHWTDWTHGTLRVKTNDNLDTVSLYLSVDSSGPSSGWVKIGGFGLFVEQS